VLQAAIAVSHAQARTAPDTDWAQIASLYDALARVLPTPIVQLNRAVTLGMARGPQTGLDLVDTLADDATLRDYHLLPGVRGDLLLRLGRLDEARLELLRATSLARSLPERDFLRRRAHAIEAADGAGLSLGQAADDFLGRGDRDAASATWNRHRAAVRSFGAWAGLDDVAAGLERHTGTGVRTEPIAAETLDALWRLDLPLRERTRWILLRESGTAVAAALSLNVQDLDLEDRRAPASAGGGRVSWRSGTAAAACPGNEAGVTERCYTSRPPGRPSPSGRSFMRESPAEPTVVTCRKIWQTRHFAPQ
jgi:hypothetical protein